MFFFYHLKLINSADLRNSLTVLSMKKKSQMACNPKNIFSGHNRTTVVCNFTMNIPAMFAKIFSGLNTTNTNLFKALFASVNLSSFFVIQLRQHFSIRWNNPHTNKLSYDDLVLLQVASYIFGQNLKVIFQLTQEFLF